MFVIFDILSLSCICYTPTLLRKALCTLPIHSMCLPQRSASVHTCTIAFQLIADAATDFKLEIAREKAKHKNKNGICFPPTEIYSKLEI